MPRRVELKDILDREVKHGGAEPHGYQITRHIASLEKIDKRAAEEFFEAFNELFHTEQGAKVLDMLTKSVLLSSPPACADDRALREIHGQRLLVAELRRLAAYG